MDVKGYERQKKPIRKKADMARLAVVSLLILAILLLHAAAVFRTIGQVNFFIREVPGCVTIGLFFLSWKAYHNEKKPLRTALLTGAAAVEVSFASVWYSMGASGMGLLTLPFLLMLFPAFLIPALNPFWRSRVHDRRLVCLSETLLVLLLFALLCRLVGTGPAENSGYALLLTADGFVWSLAENPRDGAAGKREARWKAWNGTLLLFFLSACLLGGFEWKQLYSVCWGPALMSVFPMICVLLFQKCSGRFRTGGASVCRISAAYFLAVFAVNRIFLNPLLFSDISDWKNQSDMDVVLYCLLMADIVFALEMRKNFRENRYAVKKGSAVSAAALAAAGNIITLLTAVCSSGRIREILGAITGGEDGWIAYRAAAVKSFFAGNTDILDRLCGPESREGYSELKYTGSLNAVIFQNGLWILTALIVLVVLAALLLMQWKSADARWKCTLNYLAAGYIVRTVITAVLLAFLFTSRNLTFPFVYPALTDAAVLAVWLCVGAER